MKEFQFVKTLKNWWSMADTVTVCHAPKPMTHRSVTIAAMELPNEVLSTLAEWPPHGVNLSSK